MFQRSYNQSLNKEATTKLLINIRWTAAYGCSKGGKPGKHSSVRFWAIEFIPPQQRRRRRRSIQALVPPWRYLWRIAYWGSVIGLRGIQEEVVTRLQIQGRTLGWGRPRRGQGKIRSNSARTGDWTIGRRHVRAARPRRG